MKKETQILLEQDVVLPQPPPGSGDQAYQF